MAGMDNQDEVKGEFDGWLIQSKPFLITHRLANSPRNLY